MEIYEMFCESKVEEKKDSKETKFFKIITQIVFIDVILAFDSIITAVGITDNFPIMVIALVIAMIVMVVSSNSIGNFIYANPSIKVLALAFIALLGVLLILFGFDIKVDKGYLYFAMFFSGMVEFINIKLRKIGS
jgi:predicted tellurium resistance membrane protein TerC